MKMRPITAIIPLTILVNTGSLTASQAQSAKMARVDEGVFELSEGKTIDLTDRKILLAVTANQNRAFVTEQNTINLMINGNWHKQARVGERIDILSGAHTYSFKDSLKNISKCVLDVIDIAVPKGAPIAVKFRLDCN